MTSNRFLEFLLLLLLHHQVYSQEPESIFRAKGSNIEMGYCFAADYIVVYRCTPEGDQLLGNSSSDSMPVAPPADLQGRIHINTHKHLSGLQISHLTHEDSGLYRRECWQNQTLSKNTQLLTVCDEEVETEEIAVKEDGGAALLCNNTAVGLEGTSVRWYYEMHPHYKPTLFLDSSMSMEPLVKELQGVVEVRNKGALLLFDNSTLKNIQHFICLVSKGKTCLSFQNMHLPDHSGSRDIFASQGDRVVLKCPSDGNNQHWETPQGRFNGSRMKMYIQHGDKSEDFSLVIPKVSDEHSGDYSCISSSLEMQYFLVLCPKKESQEKVVAEGGSVLLHCDAGADDSHRVQWERQEPSGEYELIHDSKDMTVAIPEDLRGRLSENGSSLTISQLKVEDGLVYRCVVLGGTELMEGGDDYEDDYGEEYAGEEDYNDGLYYDTISCIFKQDTILSVVKKTGRGVHFKPVTTRNVETVSTDDPSAAPNVTAYAVAAGLVGLLVVVGVIVAVIVIKRRAKASPTQTEAESRSGLNTKTDIKMNEDPKCTDRLNPNDRDGA